ncbi:MAG: glutamine--fructose-6-phosphate transaminase (isomerizing) [bacterium]|nr:glutamine--fructose-6-phosphate transaminase (isomerizing) [bacterium]
MCGIFGYIGTKNDAAALVLKGLKLLEYRGYDSWGVALRATGKPQFLVEKHVGKIGTATLGTKFVGASAIGHTRWATHGGVTVQNAHPHLDTKKQIALVHNGIIENYQELRDDLRAKGYVFVSETDTEVAVQLISYYRESYDFLTAVQRAVLDIQGLNALVVMDLVSDQLIAVSKGSPLALGVDGTGRYLASDAAALSEYTESVYYFQEGDLVVCQSDSVEFYEVETLTQKQILWSKLDVSAEDLSLGEYPHFMIKEIAEQPKVLQHVHDTAHLSLSIFAKQLSDELAFVGCGSAYHAALLGVYFLSSLAKRSSSAYMGSEFAAARSLFTSDGFVTFISQSGETIDLLESVAILQQNKRSFGAIVNRLGSSLERATEHKVLLGAGPEQCVLATKSWTAKVAVLFLLAHEMAGTLEQGKKELQATIQEVSRILTKQYREKYLRPLAQKLKKAEHSFVLGRGALYPAALEGALKIKEVTYIHTEGFAAGELKHGVIALIEPGTPCILLAPKDSSYQDMISTAIEIKSRGGYTIGITDEPNEVFSYCLPIRHTGLSSTIAYSVGMQLLAYELALLLDRDPDKPRNLAKSVTVK